MKIKNQKGISLIKVILIIIGLICFMLFINEMTAPKTGIGSYEEEKAEYEIAKLNSDLASLRYAISLSELKTLENSKYGYSTLDKSDFDGMGQYVQSLDSQNQWFGDSYSTFYGKILDTSTQEVTQISDGNYIATFTLIKDNTQKSNIIDIKYSFEIGSIPDGAKIFINKEQ